MKIVVVLSLISSTAFAHNRNTAVTPVQKPETQKSKSAIVVASLQCQMNPYAPDCMNLPPNPQCDMAPLSPNCP